MNHGLTGRYNGRRPPTTASVALTRRPVDCDRPTLGLSPYGPTE